jgi:putative N6-adenine-specific DNA methylase
VTRPRIGKPREVARAPRTKRPPARPPAPVTVPARARATGTAEPAPVGRGGGKLAAGLARFGLAADVHGARAVDVGASTGGFTEVLLANGARSVLAVDVGHGQLHPRLRDDPRVSSLEKTDWKRLSLDVAPGPFDFFTIDVSFTAARTMLRGLAFRLRDGANGVVLVKPQFELPDHLIKNGAVDDAGLRAQALARFTSKAEALGFRVVASFDSPVAGGEGTVELLAHVRFEGRSERLPRPGEKRARPAGAPAPARPRAPAGAFLARPHLEWFAVVAPGAEEAAAAELQRLPGGEAAQRVDGGVELSAPLEVAMRAHLAARIPTRFLLRLGQARAREFAKLRHALRRLPWEEILAPGQPVRITASTSHCRLYHTGALDETVRFAIEDRLGASPPKPTANGAVTATPKASRSTAPATTPATGMVTATAPTTTPATTTATATTTPEPGGGAPLILIRGVDDTFIVSADASGEPLFRRGWRVDTGEAPLRETLAATLLALAGWRAADPAEALYDPMCGAGTIAIEAATIALGLPPGAHRAFAFESWPGVPEPAREAWRRLRATAPPVPRPGAAGVVAGSDRDPDVVAAAARNAARAGVADVLRFDTRELAEVTPPAPSGLLIANPPYGRRLGDTRELPALYRRFGAMLRGPFAGWRAAIVVPDARLASAFRVPVAASHRVAHGGLRVTLLAFEARRPPAPVPPAA